MNKLEFLEKAPIYYALGLVVGISEDASAKSLDEISANLSPYYPHLLSRVALRDVASRLLIDEGAVIELSDDFGPTLYRVSDTFANWWEETAPRKFPLFEKFQSTGNKTEWLVSALRNVNEAYNDLGISPADFEVLEGEWEPIPLDRADPALKEVTERVDQAIEAIQSDNGYAVHAPGEREYVLSSLRVFSNELKTQSQIYWVQVKTFAIEPLSRVIKRFGDAAVGVSAGAARQAIFDWLKTNFGKLIDLIFS